MNLNLEKLLCENNHMNRFFYTVLLFIALPFTPIKLLWRAKKQPEYLQHWAERYGFYAPIAGNKNTLIIWLHCVSVGETMATVPLVQSLLQRYPNHQVLITHTTPTGRATSVQVFGDKILRAYLPYDVPFAVNRFLKHFKPTVGLLMETELWFNLIAAAKVRKMPILLVNARLSEKSARGYGKLGLLAQQGLNHLSAIAAQTEADATRLNALRNNSEATPISVMGNIKFDVTPPKDAIAIGMKLRKRLLADIKTKDMSETVRPIFLAASTRNLNGVDEESLILDAIERCAVPNLITIIVPRHPERFDAIEALIKQRGLRYKRRSALDFDETQLLNIDVLLGDSMGEMFSYYACCDVAFIGGSLLPLGGQNLIEASAVGKPTLVGPHTFNFTQVVNFAIQAGATKRVQDVEDLATTLGEMFNQPEQLTLMAKAGLTFSQKNQGATARLIKLIDPYLIVSS
jgi:3-deoxy-D-manno-octulosonic-acid transferase